MTDANLEFSISPEVILKLGEELVADEFTALLEAAKNSYDAGAHHVVIEIRTSEPASSRSSFFPDLRGFISIRDDGIGMDINGIRDGWLVVASSPKRIPKQQHLPFADTKRVPLGDKGIGRLGLHRLGHCVDLFTRDHSSSVTLHVGFDWSQFTAKQRLSDIEVRYEDLPDKRKPGTEVLVVGLRRPELWEGQDGRKRIQTKLSQLLAPLPRLSELPITVTLNGEAIDLASVAESVLATAHLDCTFNWHPASNETLPTLGGSLRINLRYSADFILSALEPDGEALPHSNPLDKTNSNLAVDEFLRPFFTDFLPARKNTRKDPGQFRPAAEKWVYEISATLKGSEIGDLKIGDPGPFEGSIYHLPRARSEADIPETFNRIRDFREFLQTQSGIRVYRNGFAIRPYGIDGDDWLRISEAREKGSGNYNLRPGNTFGFVSISASDNYQLAEKTDREGFVDSPHTQNFARLLQYIVRFINGHNNHLKRAWSKYYSSLLESRANTGRTAASLEDSLDHDPEFSNPRRSHVRKQVLGAERAAKQLSGLLTETPTYSASSDAVIGGAAESLRGMSLTIASLDERLRRQGEELQALTELASLGLTTEALSHELSNVAEALYQRTNQIQLYVRGRQPTDKRILSYLEHVRGAVTSIRKQLSHLSPSLRFARDRRAKISLKETLAVLLSYHRERLRPSGVALNEELSSSVNVIVSLGRLTQVVDNLILNAEYWAVRRPEEAERDQGMPAIFVKLNGLVVRIWDTGPGVEATMVPRLFEPFQSGRSEGRGLGLYIVRQLLDADECSISLLDDVNSFGNRYIFAIDFEGAIEGSL